MKECVRGSNTWRQSSTVSDVKTPHTLPLARIKKVMKSDEKVRMISADTPVLFSKACELFVMELSVRAWMHTQLNNRKTLQRNDVAFAIRDHSLLAFLNDIVPLESHLRDDDESIPNTQFQDNDEPIPNNNNNNNTDHGVYVPHPLPPNYMQELGGDDHQMAFPMNFPHNFNHAYFQDVNPSYPPPYDGTNPYLHYKNFCAIPTGRISSTASLMSILSCFTPVQQQQHAP
ncbi:nuclear transcription factor Y subunit C-4-like [Salvia splendens]|uniref:nuclear transcription factor Y subunit C-4-like n=1 Tax=Salvia splendens TaxID=180675 RepID=UPI001C2733EA|nr:nuclear transcription factor Y subunit C-4-like [Salvia splendens]